MASPSLVLLTIILVWCVCVSGHKLIDRIASVVAAQ